MENHVDLMEAFLSLAFYFLPCETTISHEQASAVDFNTLQFSLVNMFICQMRKNNV